MSDQEQGQSVTPGRRRPGRAVASTSCARRAWAPATGGSPARAAGALLVGLLLTSGALCVMASAAWAGVALSAAPDPPASLVVGQTKVPDALRISNASTGAQASASLTVQEITLVVSCGSQAIVGADCPPAALDPGVLSLSATGLGEAGTGCSGTSFTISPVAASPGRSRFAASSPVVLGPVGSPTAACSIDFTLDVVKAPTRDANPSVAGMQTDQVGFALGVSAGGNRGGGFGSNEVTIAPGAGPVVTPVASLDPPAAPAAPPAAATAPATAVLAPPAAVIAAAGSHAAASTAAAGKHGAARRHRPARHHRRHHSHKAARHRHAAPVSRGRGR